MNLPQNLFDGNISAQVILCQTDKTRIGEILPYDFKGTFKFNTYSEISFSIDRYYNDLLEGTTKVNLYYDLIDSLRVIEIRGVGHFVIQDVDEEVAENESKSVTCFSLEYSTGQKYLENFYVNTGEEGSIETMYHAQQYGAEYSIDNYYTLADKNPDAFDAYERYYIKDYSNDNGVSYNYVETQILNKEDYEKKYKESELYIKKYPNVRFYWPTPTKTELSLLHHIFKLIPEWKIGHVDKELWYQERTFSEDRTAVYDFLYNTAAKTFGFVMVWDSIRGEVDFYKTTEDGVTANEEIETQWNTDVFISRENLASNIDISYSTDDIKTKLKITGADSLDVRDVNLGQSYIMNLSFYNTPLWMGADLSDKYTQYIHLLEGKTDEYKKLVSERSAAYNEYSDLMNYVPVEPRVLLVGDEFDKLYCTYSAGHRVLTNEDNLKLKIGATFEGENAIEEAVKAAQRIHELQEKHYLGSGLSTSERKEMEELQVGGNVDLFNRPQIENEDGGISTVSTETFSNESGTIAMNFTPYIVDENNKYIRTMSSDELQAYAEGVIDEIVNEAINELKEKLGLYRVGVDDNGTISKIDKTDDVLLTLENAQGDSATIRVKCTKAPTLVSDGEETTYYKNSDYKVYRTKTTASSGLSKTFEYPLEDWINGTLTADEMELLYTDDGTEMPYTVKSIGTLGAYLCLAKDETKKENVEDYGIRLLQEKQDVYTKIFITQTEGYMSQEGSRCVARAAKPTGGSVGDKWLDTSSKNARIWICTTVDNNGNMTWEEYSVNEDNEGNFVDNSADFENYTRFIDNYEKLQVVQEVLKEKQYKANLLLNGIAYKEFYITKDNVNQANLLRAAITHLIVLNNPYVRSVAQPSAEYEIDGAIWFQSIDGAEKVYYWNGSKWESYTEEELAEMTAMEAVLHGPDEKTGFTYITFTPASDNKNEYTVYLSNGTPYVCYARAQGLALAKMNMIKEQTDMNAYFKTEELVRLSPFIREDEYSDDNFLLTTYESEEEEMNIKQSLLDEGIERLNKICQPKLSFSMTMANILSIPEFAPLKKQFQLGNFVRVGIRDGYVKRARLLEVQINFEDASDFSCTFGDLISTKSEIDKHADLLQQAVTVSKSVASNQSHWQKGADKATALDNAINDGLRDAALSIGAADGQAITWDRYGIRGRKLIDGTTDQYHDEQFALINNKLAFTTDNWKTSRAVVGEFEIEIPNDDYSATTKQTMYGLLADALVGGYIQGTDIVGGTLKIGDGTKNLFLVDNEGNVTIKQGGKNMYEAISAIDTAYKYSIQLSYTGSSVFSDPNQETVITAEILRRSENVTKYFKQQGVKVIWTRSSNTDDVDWKPFKISTDTYQITIKNSDIPNTAQISCYIEPTEADIEAIETKFND